MAKQHVVVVGSGIAGASTAFALAQRGIRVTVVDAGHDGQATAASAGIVEPWSSSMTGPGYQLYAAGAAFYPEFLRSLAEVGVLDTGYRVNGTLVASADAAELDMLQRLLLDRTTGVPAAGSIERLSGADARGLFSGLATDLAAVRIGGGARVANRRSTT